MQRFTYDLLRDVTEDTEDTYEQELISRRTIPAFATDDQRRDLMLWMVDAIDEVTFTSQRIQVEQSKDCVTIRRLLGGGYDPEIHGDAHRTPRTLFDDMREEISTVADEELTRLENELRQEVYGDTQNENN